MENQKLQLFLNKLNSDLVNDHLSTVSFLKEILEKMAFHMEYEDDNSLDQLKNELEFLLTHKDHKYIEKFFNLSQMSDFLITKGYFSNQGRGSEAASMICYSLKITKFNPKKFNLDWERFLNIHSDLIIYLDIPPQMGKEFHQFLKDTYSNRLYYAGSESKTKITRALKNILESPEYKYSYSKTQELIREIDRQISFQYPEIHTLEVDELKESIFFLELLKEKSQIFIDLFTEKPEIYPLLESMMKTVRWRGKHPARFFIIDKDMSEHIVELDENNVPVLSVKSTENMMIETYHVLKMTVLKSVNDFLNNARMDANINDYLNFNDNRVFRLMNETPEKLQDIFHLSQISKFKKLNPNFIFNSIESIAEYSTVVRNGDSFISDYKDGGNPPLQYVPLLESMNGHLIYQEQIMMILRFHNLDSIKYFKLFIKNKIRYQELKDIMSQEEFDFLIDRSQKTMNKAHVVSYAHYTYLDILFRHILFK